jgi:hypothetical protein
MFAEDSDNGNNMVAPPFAPRGSLTGTLVNGGHGADDGVQPQLASDDLNWLYGFSGTQPVKNGYVPALKTFVCPTTHNDIRPDAYDVINPEGTMEVLKLLYDLEFKAKDKDAVNGPPPFGGHSYEVFGWWHRYEVGSGKFPRRTLQTVQTYQNVNYNPGMKPGPARIFTIMDRLEVHTGVNYENAPNRFDGHGVSGANVVFTDGHGQFVPGGKWQDVYRTSEDDNQPNDGKVTYP